MKKGFKGKIYSHKATVDLCEIMLPDSGYIQETETEWVNRKRIRAGLPTIDPLYTYMDAQNPKLLCSVSYDRSFILHPHTGLLP